MATKHILRWVVTVRAVYEVEGLPEFGELAMTQDALTDDFADITAAKDVLLERLAEGGHTVLEPA